MITIKLIGGAKKSFNSDELKIDKFDIKFSDDLSLGTLKNPLIINLSSRLGSIHLRGDTQLGGAIAYQCSKAALNMLTRQTSVDLKPFNIRVISQSPGWVKTEMGGQEAKYQVEEAVSMMLHALEKLPHDKTGIFIGEDGEPIPW